MNPRRLIALTVIAMLVVSCEGGGQALQDTVGALVLIVILSFVAYACVLVGILVAILFVVSGGAITVVRNLMGPTRRTRVWGFVFGGLNAALGALAGALVLVGRFRDPPPELSGSLIGAAISAAFLALGLAGIAVAARAVPRERLAAAE